MLILFSHIAFSQEEDATFKGFGDESGTPQKTIINFEEEVLEGGLARPDELFLESRKKVRHSNLIRVRENFKDRIFSAVLEL